MEYLLLGFITGLSLILAIGAQNIFVIEQGLKKQYVFIGLNCDPIIPLIKTVTVAAVNANTWLDTSNERFLFMEVTKLFSSLEQPYPILTLQIKSLYQLVFLDQHWHIVKPQAHLVLNLLHQLVKQLLP